VEQFCEHALLLHDSQMVYLGTAVEAVKRFYFVQQTGSNYSKVLAKNDIKRTETKYQENGGMDWPIPEAFIDLSNFPQVSNQQASCTAAAICSQDGESSLVFQQGEVASFFYEFIVNEEIEVPIGGVEIINDKGVIVHGKNSLLYGSQAPAYVAKGGRVRFRQDIKLDIAAGEYTFNIGFSTISQQDYAARKDLPHPELDAKIKILSIVLRAGKFAVVYRLNGEPVQLTHFGTANLQGQCQVTVI